MAVATLATAILLGACGEREFDTQTLIENLNSNGAELTLGESLPTDAEGIDLTVVEMAGGGSGTVVNTAGVDEAREEFVRCESAGPFICFRVANAVLRFSDLDRAGIQQLTAAVTALQTQRG